MNDFENMLAIAHTRLVLLSELKQTTDSLKFMTGVAVGTLGTIFSAGVVWVIWRLI